MNIMDTVLQHGIILYLLITITSQCLHEDEDYVICTGQGHVKIPNRFPQSIRHLILSKNNISTIERTVLQRYPQIRHLNLNYNQIRSSDSIRAVSELKNLQVFSISGNNLFVLNFQVFSMNLNLQEIIADENPGIYIREEPVNLGKLERISLKRNKLTSFPVNAFKMMSGLKILDLQNNELNMLPEDLDKQLPNLKLVYLSGNHILHLDYPLMLKSDLKLSTNFPKATSEEEVKLTEDNQNHRFVDEIRTTRAISISGRNETVKRSTFENMSVEPTAFDNSSKPNENIPFSPRKAILIAIYAVAILNGILIVIAISLAYLHYIRRRKTECRETLYYN